MSYLIIIIMMFISYLDDTQHNISVVKGEKE